MLGALIGLWATGGTLNLFSQIGIVMLVGLAAKNGILIVEFANQLRDAGRSVRGRSPRRRRCACADPDDLGGDGHGRGAAGGRGRAGSASRARSAW